LAIAFKSSEHLIPRTVERTGAIAATDGELLTRFAGQRDHRAFAEIVERHGRLVWMICQQVLRHQQDVEDAFQATFLILAKRARTIRASDSAAAWLFKVAHRTALAARRKRTSRREEPLAHDPPVGEEGPRMIDDREMLYVLLQEIRMLPAQYQTPLLMRYLEGHSRRAIAEQTDSTVGQVHGRLVRGRRMLRARVLRRGMSLSLAAGAIADTAALAEAAVTPTLVSSTSKTCLAFITSGAVGGLSPAALELVKEGIKAMWIVFVTKCTAVVSTVLLTAGIVWAAHQGGDNGENTAGTSAANQINLQVAAAAPAEANQGTTIVAATNASRPVQDAGVQREQYTQKIKKQFDDVELNLVELMGTRSENAAQLEMQLLDKTLLQRELEQLHGILVELNFPQVSPRGEPPKGSQEKRDADRNIIHERLESVKKQLAEQTVRAAKTSADLERHQLEVTRTQRRLDELDRLSSQLELPQELPHPAQSTSIPNKIIGEQLLAENFQRAVMQQVQQLEGAREALQAENAELKKELEMLNKAAPIAAWYSPEAKASLLQWDSLQKNKQQAEQSAQSKAVQTGGAALNAQQQNSDPLQVVPASVLNNSTHRIDELQRTLEKVQAENDELKKQLERRKTSTPSKKQDTSQRIIRPGDEVIVRLKAKKPLTYNNETIYTVDDQGKITLDSRVGSPTIKVAGLDQSQSTEAVRKSLEHPESWEEVRVELGANLR
jgi:RNA polymerase sigma factor (sigma-70 family)